MSHATNRTNLFGTLNVSICFLIFCFVLAQHIINNKTYNEFHFIFLNFLTLFTLICVLIADSISYRWNSFDIFSIYRHFVCTILWRVRISTSLEMKKFVAPIHTASYLTIIISSSIRISASTYIHHWFIFFMYNIWITNNVSI